MEYIKKIIFLVVVILILGLSFLWYRKRMTPPSEQIQPAPPVPIAQPILQDVVRYSEFTGNIEAIESVDIRARVQGFLKEVAFKDGGFVKKGDLLFDIEPDTYQADRDRAFANLQSSLSDYQRAQEDYDRVTKAVTSGAVSIQNVSKYKVEVDLAESRVVSARSDLKQAELNLSYTKIYSPIDGKISRRYVDPGNLVGASEMTLLARVVKLDPLHVYFNASESEYLNYEKDLQENRAPSRDQLPVFLTLANNISYPHQGYLDYLDNEVDSATGTIQIRGVVPNPDNILYPGMFVRIRVPGRTLKDAILVQDKAIGTDLSGKFVLVVGQDNIIQQRQIEISDLVDDLRVVENGLAAGEKYIVTGTQFIRPGMLVVPVPEGQMPPMGAPATAGAETQEQDQ